MNKRHGGKRAIRLLVDLSVLSGNREVSFTWNIPCPSTESVNEA